MPCVRAERVHQHEVWRQTQRAGVSGCPNGERAILEHLELPSLLGRLAPVQGAFRVRGVEPQAVTMPPDAHAPAAPPCEGSLGRRMPPGGHRRYTDSAGRARQKRCVPRHKVRGEDVFADALAIRPVRLPPTTTARCTTR